ncbi:MAG: ribosomal-processing cysteine protease Prp [Ruminococcus sp.]|nr:ribosomal-processing cysteine protease Prp [Ruminococcus sp.]
MISVCFIRSSGSLTGFELSGHSGFAQEGSDIVCAAVSSAAYMTANTVTEILGLPAQLSVDEAFMSMKLSTKNAMKAQDVLRGFELHLMELSQQFNSNITVNYSEV